MLNKPVQIYPKFKIFNYAFFKYNGSSFFCWICDFLNSFIVSFNMIFSKNLGNNLIVLSVISALRFLFPVKGRFTLFYSPVSEVNCILPFFYLAYYDFWGVQYVIFSLPYFLPQSVSLFKGINRMCYIAI